MFLSCSITSNRFRTVNTDNIVNVNLGQFIISKDFAKADESENSFKFISDHGRSLRLYIADDDFGGMKAELNANDAYGTSYGAAGSTSTQLGKNWPSSFMIHDTPLSQLGVQPGTGYIQNLETGSGYAFTPGGYSYVDKQNFDQTYPALISENEGSDTKAELYASLNLNAVKQEDPVNCIEEGIQWLRDIGFFYCISQFKSEFSVTYTYGSSSIIYTEKTDDLKSFKRKGELTKLVDFVYNK